VAFSSAALRAAALLAVEIRFALPKSTLDCGGTTPLLLHALLAPAALEFTAALALPGVQEKR